MNASAPPDNIDNLGATLEPIIKELEAQRHHVIGQTLNASIVAAILVILLYVGLAATGNLHVPLPFLLIPVLIGIAVVAFIHSSNAKSYRTAFKTLIIARLVSAIGPQLSYVANGYISEGDFRASQLFRSPDRYNGEDLVNGQHGETQLRFSEIHAEYRTRDSKGRTQWHTIFRGLFFIADFNKQFMGITMVLPDTAERLFGGFGQSLQALGTKLSFSNRELVKLEDPEFEQQFVVYATDQIEARYLLSMSLMRRLLDFRHKAGCEVRAAFVASQLYVALPLNENLFEPPMFGAALDVASLDQYVEQLRFVLGIVDDLDLNTRIWSKQ